MASLSQGSNTDVFTVAFTLWNSYVRLSPLIFLRHHFPDVLLKCQHAHSTKPQRKQKKKKERFLWSSKLLRLHRKNSTKLYDIFKNVTVSRNAQELSCVVTGGCHQLLFCKCADRRCMCNLGTARSDLEVAGFISSGRNSLSAGGVKVGFSDSQSNQLLL